MPLKLKEEYKKTYVAFGKSNKVLGERDDLHILAKLGLVSNKQLLKYFEDPLPTIAEIQQMESDDFKKIQSKKKSETKNP